VIARFTLDSASEFLFGKNVESLDGVLPYPHNVAPAYNTHSIPADDFPKAFAEAQYIISERFNIGWPWPLLEIFEDKTKKPMKVVNAFL
jgi:hypothetical protein